jgi:hypothetical protein
LGAYRIPSETGLLIPSVYNSYFRFARHPTTIHCKLRIDFLLSERFGVASSATLGTQVVRCLSARTSKEASRERSPRRSLA